MRRSIDINCDMGEGCGNDAALMPYISSANISCGYHAGDAATMRETIELAARHGVAVGAHPSYRDRENFGRTDVELSAAELRTLILEQLEIFAGACREIGVTISHVKPHGALYNRSARDAAVAQAIAEAVLEFDAGLTLYGLAQSHSTEVARSLGLKAADEAFADRAYEPDGSLVSRR
ncbi:MAG TPA: 5-oxoprolinase subunit PxpA, partial [Pyrinomonadaceae bacterium]|nr:5-oxoprolinase subunit PxpA [Pyrinomonadaceae bacterium]